MGLEDSLFYLDTLQSWGKYQEKDKNEGLKLLRRFKRATKQIHSKEDLFSVQQCRDYYSIPNLQRLLSEYPESVTAKAMLDVAVNAQDGIESIRKAYFQEDGKKFVEKRLVVDGVHSIGQAIRKNPRIANCLLTHNDETVQMIAENLHWVCKDTTQDSKTRAEALLVKAYFDCFFSNEKLSLQQLSLAHLMNPDDADFHAVGGFICFELDQHERAVKEYQRAKQLGCKILEMTLLAQARAAGRILSDETMALGESCREEFLKLAEKDDEMLPAAYYLTAYKAAMRGPGHLGVAKRYQEMGEEADKNRLPGLPDYAVAIREGANTLLKRYDPCGNDKCDSEAYNKCSGCEAISYCSAECQKADWKLHKTACKKAQKKKMKENKNMA